MSDADKESKTEDPTEKKLSDARASGNFAKAPELSMVTSLLASLLVFTYYGEDFSGHLSSITVSVLGHLNEFDVTLEGIEYTMISSFTGVVGILMPLMFATMATGIITEGIQTGFRFTPKVIGFKPEKLNPIQGFKRIFGTDSLVNFGIDFLKFLSIAGIVMLLVRDIMKDPIFYTPVPVNHVGQFIYDLFRMMLIRLILLLAIIAVINYIWKKHKNTQDMKMTKEEVKEDRKSKEVNPEIKSQQKAKAMQILSKQMMSNVPTADVVVTNPTHFAVALKYERGKDKAPIVIAKGQNLFAKKIKKIAKSHNVPMVENKPVAQMLFKYGAVGRPIPLELYQVVAEILAYVYKTHSYYFHRLKARRLLAK
jgi:flagellar biosynthetic protein FlhB